jgi:hypothetical protein
MTSLSRRARFAAIILVVMLAPSLLWSQVPGAPNAVADVSIRLQSTGGSPLEGALVALLDGRDSVIAEGLSREDGRRMLRAPPGTYRVRARRIGFLPFISHPVVLPQREELLLTVETPHVVLNSIVVNARSGCKPNDSDSRSLGVVWDEIDKALRASQLTIQDLAGFGRGRLYRKELGYDGAVLSSDTTFFPITNRRPFGTRDPEALAQRGYVLGDHVFGWDYSGPDETVLRSESFAQTHCFRLVREAARRGQIGVAFEPIPRRSTPDIKGVLWVDDRTSELREMAFSYVNAGPVSQFNGGGFTRFMRLPSGAWLVSEWWLRAPRLEMRTSPYSAPRYSAVGYIENGGGILSSVRQARNVVDSLNTKR